MSTTMNIWQQELSQGVRLLGVRGRLDQNLTPQLEASLTKLLDEGHYHLIIDLTEVNYINSGGLRCLVSAWRRARQQNGNVVLSGLNTRLDEIFSMVGFDKVFRIYPDPNAALKEIGNSG